MSAAPVAALLPHFQCASSSSFLPVPSSDPLLLAASPVHDSCFACLRSGMPSPLPPERKIPTCICRSGSFSHGRSYGGMGYISLFPADLSSPPHLASRNPLFANTFLVTVLFRSFPFAVPLSQSSFVASLSQPPTLRPLFCGFPFVVPFSRPPLCYPLSRPLCGSPLLRPPGKGYFWNR